MGRFDENFDWHDAYEPYEDFERNYGCGCLIVLGTFGIALVLIALLIMFLA